MKESITKFDLEAAFKALDEIEVPKAGKVKANKPALTEIFARKSKFDALMEEYYDIGNTEELEGAKDAREAEIAQAKLARIEKIVDLDAESADDLLTSYVGKFIIQCPQCMTLFYKKPEDVEASEGDPATVNVNEVCQHCGNESGYSLIGKVGEATSEEPAVEEPAVEEPASEENDLDLAGIEDEAGEAAEENTNETSDELADLEELELLDLDNLEDNTAEEDEEEKKEEAFFNSNGQLLNEELTEATDVTADEFGQLIRSAEFKKPISDAAVEAMLAMESFDGDITEAPLDEVFGDVEELQESTLESMIADSLVQMYGNVASFKLTECVCKDNKLLVEGIILFTSGNTRNTTYTFNEAFVKANKVTLRGLNEKLGTNKHFYIAGYTENKTFITESLKVTKD